MSSSSPRLPSLFKKEQKSSVGALIARTVLFMGGVVLFTWGLHAFFKWAIVEPVDVTLLYERWAGGRTDTRLAAAREWVRQLNEAEVRGRPEDLEKLRPQAEPFRHLVQNFPPQTASCRNPADEELLRLFALWCGYAQPVPEARLWIADYLKSHVAGDCPAVRVAALSSGLRLGGWGPESVAQLEGFAQESDPAMRKLAAYGLGLWAQKTVHPQERARWIAQLEELRHDAVEDVRWNALLALLSLKERSVEPAVVELLRGIQDQRSLSASELSFYQQVLRESAWTQNEQLRHEFERLAQRHPNLGLRQTAKEILKDRE